jgi:hypothetical protein
VLVLCIVVTLSWLENHFGSSIVLPNLCHSDNTPCSFLTISSPLLVTHEFTSKVATALPVE